MFRQYGGHLQADILNKLGNIRIGVVRIIVDLSKSLLRRIFETKEREAERYVTRIAGCLHIVLQ